MSVLIEYIEEHSHRFRAVKFGVPPICTIEDAAKVLQNFKVKHIKVVKFNNEPVEVKK